VSFQINFTFYNERAYHKALLLFFLRFIYLRERGRMRQRGAEREEEAYSSLSWESSAGEGGGGTSIPKPWDHDLSLRQKLN